MDEICKNLAAKSWEGSQNTVIDFLVQKKKEQNDIADELFEDWGKASLIKVDKETKESMTTHMVTFEDKLQKAKAGYEDFKGKHLAGFKKGY